MMNVHLQQRFNQLIEFAKDPQYCLIAMENIAAAREMIDTLYASHLLPTDDYKALHAKVTSAQVIVSAAQLKKAQDARIWDMNLFDGSRV